MKLKGISLSTLTVIGLVVCLLCLSFAVQAYVKGDLNKDGVVDDADIATLEQILVEADINEDGIVSGEDVDALIAIIYPPGPSEIVDRQVEASSDDCYTFRDIIRLTRNCLFIDECSNYMHTYLRFTDVNIPQGATIEHAYVDLCSDAYHGGRSFLRIYGIKESNTDTFSTQADADGRSMTDAYVEWTMNGFYQNQTWLPGIWYGWTNDPHDIKHIIQEIVDQPDWQASNALAIKIVNTVHESNSRTCYSWDYGDHSLAPKLHIEYAKE